MRQIGVVGPYGAGFVDMEDRSECGNCGDILSPEPEGQTERTPCPKCGSTDRKFSVVMTEGINVSDSAVARFIRGIMLKTIVEKGETTDEGVLIEAVLTPWFDIVELMERDPAAIYQIASRKWEEIIAGAYKAAGFDVVILTPHSGDHGRDIIATKRGIGSIRVIDQVKAYKPDHLVIANDVRALMGVLQTDGAAKGFLTTTSDFAPRLAEDPLIKPLMPSRLELVNGVQLQTRLRELAKTRKT